MNGVQRVTGSESRACPPYRGVIVVDAESFSRAESSAMPQLSADIPGVLETAFHRCGLGTVWDRRRFPDGTGDGVVFGVRPRDVPFVIHPLIDTLQEVLEEHDRVLRVRSRDLRLRLRMSINVGPVPDSGIPGGDRISKPTIDTFRVADAPVVKERLKATHPDVTLLVAVLSQRVYEDMVLGGYTGIHPSRFTRVNADVTDKRFTQPAWIYVPQPSERTSSVLSPAKNSDGDSLPSRERGEQDVGPRIGGVFHERVENAITAGEISAPLTINGRKSGARGRGTK